MTSSSKLHVKYFKNGDRYDNGKAGGWAYPNLRLWPNVIIWHSVHVYSGLTPFWFRRTFWFPEKEPNVCHRIHFLGSKYTTHTFAPDPAGKLTALPCRMQTSYSWTCRPVTSRQRWQGRITRQPAGRKGNGTLEKGGERNRMD